LGTSTNRPREGNHWNDSAQYKQYLQVLENNPRLTLRQATSKEIKSVNDLLEEQFLVVSDDYVSWVDAEEERRTLAVGEQQGPSEGILKARRQDRAKTLRIQGLEKQVRDLKRQNEESRRTQRRLRRRLRNLEQRSETTDPVADGPERG
jgi:hypothetical protein